MATKHFTLTIIGLSLALFSASGAEIIPADWQAPTELRRIRIVRSSASSTVDPANGNYAVTKAADGDRKSKWAAAELPSDKAPQRIDLDFGGEERVSAVAVFGERIGNDGIVDAQVQVGVSNTFRTVGSITNATSGSWLVSFPPVDAKNVRLMITRSSGPSPHTDVYEVEVYGQKLSAVELRSRTAQRLAASQSASENQASGGLAEVAWFDSLRKASTDLANHRTKLETAFRKWDSLAQRDQEHLADEIDLFFARVTQGLDKSAIGSGSYAAQLRVVLGAREWFAKARDSVTTQTSGKETYLFNKHVLLELHSNKTWSAVWNGKADAAVFRVSFAADANGKPLAEGEVTTEITDFQDKLGSGRQVTHRWGDSIRLERFLRIYHDSGAITVSGRIQNLGQQAILLGSIQPLSVVDGWQCGDVMNFPGAVYIVGASEFQCTPGRRIQSGHTPEQNYSSSQILNLTHPKSEFSTETRGLTVGFLTAFTARPSLKASFRLGTGGLSLDASQQFLGRRLDPGETLSIDPVYLCANDDSYAGLESYADAAAHFAVAPVRKGATALWCSWYGHRMAISEDLVLANAAVAAKYLKPLGFEIMQLDHGWQVGDVTGNWTPDKETFPHGFKWLYDELKSRYGLKLGLWIAPTDVAETSEVFRQHPEWMLKDGAGKPLVNWKWYWKPNPNCYELDVSNPDAARWMENVFAQLSADGVSYYKIDFIAASGGEQFVQQNPKFTRGWSVLRQAMESVRRGAGEKAWIRYCQPPPLLSAGLADSAYGGDDTLDAGLNGDIHVLRSNARSLAASYWINDRLYHREVCDMSVRMQADIEEVRMRLAMMTLANCSISFSDELQYLPPSRIRMMQACLPPGNPPMKPLDLFDRTIPSVWHIHCTNAADQWEVVGLFNFENTPEVRQVDFAGLDLPPDADIAGFEFWEEKFAIYRTNLTVSLPPQSSRIFAFRRLANRPQLVGTDLHLLQGQHELTQMKWDDATSRLSGECKRAPGLEGKLFFYVPASYAPHFEFPLNEKSARLTHIDQNLWGYEIHFDEAVQQWAIPFDRK